MVSYLPKCFLNDCFIQDKESNICYLKDNARINEPVFLSFTLVFMQKNPKLPVSLFLEWLTINHCQIKFININIKCKIHVTAHATIIAENCTFVPVDSKCECSVEIFANSKGIFKNCHFTNSNKASIAIRDRSEAIFTDCLFDDAANTSILVLDKSTAEINQCTFKTANRFSVYLYRNSTSKIIDSKFISQKGKGIFMLTSCQAHIINCIFNECQGGGISIAESSTIYVDRCNFNDIGVTSIHAIKKSTAFIARSHLNKCNGNGVNFDYSNGYVYKCTFHDYIYPAIVCYGQYSNPVIYDSKIKNCSSFAIASRDCASPIFSKLKFANIESNVFSISDFSNVVIQNSVLKNVSKTPFSVFNGAKAIIKQNLISYANIIDNAAILFQSFTQGNATYLKNIVISNKISFVAKVHNFGQTSIDRFKENFLIIIDESHLKLKNISITKGNLMSIDETSQIYIDNNCSYFKEPIVYENFDKEKEEQNEDELIGTCFCSECQSNNLKAEEIIKNKNMINCPKIPKLFDNIAHPSDLPKPLQQIDINVALDEIKKIDNNYDDNSNYISSSENKIDLDAAAAGHLNLGVCLKCGKNPADHVAIPCGHKVLCKECAEECKNTQQQADCKCKSKDNSCPLCDTPIKCSTEEFVEQKCVICLDNLCDTTITPCGHRCVCYECATQLMNDKKKCPLCQARIESYRYNFKIMA